MLTPVISVIVPVYDVEAYIRECVESIIGQEGNFEVILVDDGSPDGCAAICDGYAAKDRRIRVIHKSNGGVSSARNAGLDMARGEWIWFVDSDDYIAENAFAELGKIIDNDAEADLICFGHRRLKGNDVSTVETETADKVERDVFLQRYHSYMNQTMLFRRDIIESRRLRFTEDIRLGEDLEFQYKYLTLCRRPVQYARYLYVYRLRELSATKSDSYRYRNVYDSLRVLENLLDYVKEEKAGNELWFGIKVRNIMRNVLFSASVAKGIDLKDLQRRIRRIMDLYRNNGMNCLDSLRLRLAYWNVRLYFALNYVYLGVKKLFLRS